jgi:phenylacetate-CoA ligase
MKEWAYTLHLWKRVGYTPDSSRLLLRGKVFRSQQYGRDWQYDALRRELSCNIFNLSEENLEQYCLAIEKYKPDYIHGYMSSTVILCKYIERRRDGIRHHFKGVLAVSETVLETQREYVERVLETRVYSFYGHSERLVMAGECEHSTDYHVEPLYGYAEIIDKSGKGINGENEGELVATGFCNKGMPMLRYKTGDITRFSQKPNCKCRRQHLRLLGVSGRWKQDLLVTNNNALVSLTAINMHSDVFDKIIKYQFFQDTIGKVTLKVVPTKDYSDIESEKILTQLYQKTQRNIKYDIKLVKDIPVNTNGKYSIVDQKLNIDFFKR